MPDMRRRTCRVCGKHAEEVGHISWAGRCKTCGIERVRENIAGLHHHSGEPFQRWRKAMAASVGGVLLDDAPDSD